MKTLKYCPELNQTTGSITASLLLCQLEYWFLKKDYKPFYKFLEPCEDEHYHLGDSWTEELGFTKSEFRSAFRRIGKVYKSKSEYKKSTDKFEGKLYLSYYDRIRKLTYYIRNHEEVNKLLENQHCSLPYSEDYPSSKTNPIVKDRLVESHTPYEQVLSLFHKCCPSLKPVTTLTTHCKHQLDKLWHKLKAKGQDALACLEAAFTAAEQSDFLCKRGTSSNWQAAFGWIIRPDKFFAILEGAYETFKAPAPKPAYPKKNTTSQPFLRMYTHGFDIQALEARENAYLEYHYGSPK